METGRSCRARWRIAAAAHNIHVLIGQIACQSSSLRTVNCDLFLAEFIEGFDSVIHRLRVSNVGYYIQMQSFFFVLFFFFLPSFGGFLLLD